MTDKRFFSVRQDFSAQLLMLYTLFVAIVLVGAVALGNLLNRRLEADVRAADLALARAIAQETNAALTSSLEAVRQLGAYTAVIEPNTTEMEQIFSTVLRGRTDINLIYRLDSDGTMLFHVPVGPESTVGRDFSFRDYFQAALTSRAPLVSKGRISPTTNQPVATTVMPLWQDGRFLGLVGTNIKLQSLSYTLSSIADEYQPEEGLQIFIVDAAGQIIAHSNPDNLLQDANQTIPEAVTAVLAHKEAGSQILSDADGRDSLYSYVPIFSVGWGAIVSHPNAAAFATPRVLQRGILIAGAVFLAGGVLYWLFLSQRVIRPLARLTAFSQSIGQGENWQPAGQPDLTPITRRPDQIGHLARSLMRMQRSITARLNELSTLLATSAAVVSSLDSPTVLDRILEQVERLMDIQMSAIFALDEDENQFRVQASRGLSQWYIDHTIIDPQEPGSVTMRAIRSGKPIQISDTETNPAFISQRPRARIAGFQSVLAVPLHLHHTLPAALLVFRPDAHEFTNREINLLANFANHAAMAIENAALFASSDIQLQEQTQRLEALIQSMQDGLVLEDLSGRILYANRRVYEFVGALPEEISENTVESLMARLLADTQDKNIVCEAVDKAVAGYGRRRVEFAIHRQDAVQYVRLRVFDVVDANGALMGRGRILQDVTQRHEIDRMKSSLIATVSHELRTPLAAIKGYATTLLADDVKWDSQSEHEFLAIISSETDHLSTLVDDLLDMSRIEAGNLQVSRTLCDLRALIQQAVLHAHPQPGERMQVILPPDLPPIKADAKRIEAVLRNLIENAAKYSGDDVQISVRAEASDGHLVVKVEDDGPGIPTEQSEQIFGSFYRIENGLTRNTAGAGLGLAISRGFIHAHGGKIWVETRPKGACVAFSLPLEVN